MATVANALCENNSRKLLVLPTLCHCGISECMGL